MASTKPPTLSNGAVGGGDFMAFAAAIVAAIKDQTISLTQAGLNAPRY
jgi:hypothetical protein